MVVHGGNVDWTLSIIAYGRQHDLIFVIANCRNLPSTLTNCNSYMPMHATAKSICYFDNCNCYQNCNCLTRNSPMHVAAIYIWQYNTHGEKEQLKLLQGLGSLLRHQVSAIHNKGHCSLAKILVM